MTGGGKGGGEARRAVGAREGEVVKGAVVYEGASGPGPYGFMKGPGVGRGGGGGGGIKFG